MAVLHIAWIRFNASVPAERIEQHLAACRGLVVAALIPDVAELRVMDIEV